MLAKANVYNYYRGNYTRLTISIKMISNYNEA